MNTRTQILSLWASSKTEPTKSLRLTKSPQTHVVDGNIAYHWMYNAIKSQNICSYGESDSEPQVLSRLLATYLFCKNIYRCWQGFRKLNSVVVAEGIKVCGHGPWRAIGSDGRPTPADKPMAIGILILVVSFLPRKESGSCWALWLEPISELLVY